MKRIALLTMAAGLGLAVLPAVPAAADGQSAPYFNAPQVSVTSSTGLAMRLLISASKSGSSTAVSVQLDRASAGTVDENHTWSFTTSGSVLTYSGSSGSLATGSQLGPYGSLKLTFARVSSSTTSCKTFSGKATKVTTTKVSVKGIVNFAARTPSAASSWGSVKKGTASSPYKFGGADGLYVSWTNGPCNTPVNSPCITGWAWDAFQGNATNDSSAYGEAETVSGYGTTSQITASRFLALSTPAHAHRSDTVTVSAPAPAFNGSSSPNTMTVTTKSGTAASGGGTISASGNPSTFPGFKCKVAGSSASHTQTTTDYDGTWANASKKLALKMAIGGTFGIPEGVSASFEHFSYT